MVPLSKSGLAVSASAGSNPALSARQSLFKYIIDYQRLYYKLLLDESLILWYITQTGLFTGNVIYMIITNVISNLARCEVYHG